MVDPSTRPRYASVAESPEAFARDPENLLLWRYDRRQLSAEETRDAMLFVSGLMDRTQAEGHPFDKTYPDLTEHKPFRGDYASNHRSVYVMQQRNRRHPYFEVFDGASTTACTGERGSSITPLQALFQLNSPDVAEWSRAVAGRVKSAGNAEAQVAQLYRLILARDAAAEEIQIGTSYLKRFESTVAAANPAAAPPLASLARALFANNEFMFVE